MLNAQWFGVNFLLDTGANTTSLHPVDALHGANIPALTLLRPHLWTTKRDHSGIGGGATYFLVPCTFAFIQDDGQLKIITNEIGVGQLRTDNQFIPSLLGWDILQQFNLRLDWASRTIGLY